MTWLRKDVTKVESFLYNVSRQAVSICLTTRNYNYIEVLITVACARMRTCTEILCMQTNSKNLVMRKKLLCITV